jgi:hypothetical protein
MPFIEFAIKIWKNPIASFIYSLLLAFVVLVSSKSIEQIIGIIVVFFVFGFVSLVYATYEEKVSARRYQEKNAELQDRIKKIDDDRKKLKAFNEELEREIPKVIRNKSVHKRIKIKDKSGSATLSITYNGENISNRPIQTIKHSVCTKKELSDAKIKKALINEEEVFPRVESKPCGEGYESKIILDALEAIDPGDPIVTSYDVELDEEYGEAFEENKEDNSTHSIYLRLDKLTMEIEAPAGFIFYPNPRTDVYDVFNGVEIFEEKDRLDKDKECRPTLDSSRRKLIWIVKYPRISYIYEAYFHFTPVS